MLKTLTSRRWLVWLLVATVWAVGCFFLGRWQWHRWEDKSTTQSRISKNYDATPTSLSDVMTPTKPLAPAHEWKQVRMSGHYVGPTELVRNRPNDKGDFGYEVVNIFATGSQQVLVDRGWVANGVNAGTPSTVPKAPAGTITVVGWARPSERSLGRPPVPGQLSSISIHDVDARYRDHLAQGYVRMREETAADGSHPSHPQPLGKPSQGMAAGINLSYAIQWWLGIVAGYWFVLMRARREHLDGLMQSGEPTSRVPKAKKQRIWDEEDA